MKTARLEAFSDGVMAIIITIMVLELIPPKGVNFSDLMPLMPKFLSYIFSFIYVGIYWNNHHHLFYVTEHVNGKILWANMLLLFTISLIPFTTAWMGENHFAQDTVTLYGINLFLAALAFIILGSTAKKSEGSASLLARSITAQRKEKASIVIYALGIALSFFYPVAAIILFYVVAIIWIIPDSRIEKQLK